MSAISAQLVKQLREKTGVGFLACKQALAANDGDLNQAADWLRQKGESVAAGKSSRAAAEGVLTGRCAEGCLVLLEVNCETDSVARLDNFQNFTEQLLTTIASRRPRDVEQLMEEKTDGRTFEDVRQQLVSQIGENIQVRRFMLLTDQVEHCHLYIHGGRIAGVVKINIDDQTLGHDMAMQLVASQTEYISMDDIPDEMRQRERQLIAAGLADSSKPEEIKQRIVEGKLNKQLGSLVLEQQPYLKDNQITVAQRLAQNKARIEEIHLWRRGEGIEKPVTDFVREVQQQAAQADQNKDRA